MFSNSSRYKLKAYFITEYTNYEFKIENKTKNYNK